MSSKQIIKGLWVPLVTPFNWGKLDIESLIRLIQSTEPYVEGFIPCLSSGEGRKIDDKLWAEVITTVKENTKKPVIAGIYRELHEEILYLSKQAKNLGCIAIATPIQGNNPIEQEAFCEDLSKSSALSMVIYNNEKNKIDDFEVIKAISKLKNIIAIKDSSQDQKFFNEIMAIKKEENLPISILQGMENQLLESGGCDGFVLSLANIEPKLCKDMLENPSIELNNKIMEKWDELGLASDTFFEGIKKALVSRGIINSADLIN